MDSQKFVEGYRHSPDRYRFYETRPELEELMKGPRKWASFFDRKLYKHLEGSSGDSLLDTNNQLISYEYGWVEPFLDGIIRDSQGMAFYDEKSASAVNELNFHILNKEFLPMWRRALMPETHPQLAPEEIQLMQTNLALRGAELDLVKNDALKWQKIEESPIGLVKAMNGQITEIDAAIVMLEILKDEPQLILLPAPPHFESAYRSSRSIDFIIMDTNLGLSRGIQVKSYIDSIKDASNTGYTKSEYKPTRKYDGKFVTLIDGMIDLGNATNRYILGRGNVIVPSPGQISASFLQNPASPDIANAMHNIKDRIIRDLHKN